jgi:hypothetical protein
MAGEQRARELEDLDPMPFGKHRTMPMQDVPASYLHYLWTKGLKNETATSPVARYIKRHLNHLKKEHPDGIWE